MGVLNAFYSTWNKARETFGQGTPDDGSQYDGSSRLMEMKASVEAAAPDNRWQGTASAAYAAANTEHAQVFVKLAELDKRMASEVKNAAGVVTAGRQNLDTTKDWVDSMAASVPNTKYREIMLIPVVNKGIGEVNGIVQKATDEMSDIKGRLDNLRGEYHALRGNMKFGPEWAAPSAVGEKAGNEIRGGLGSETGSSDGDSLKDGKLSPEESARLLEAGTLDPKQLEDLAAGKDVVIGADRMAYLYQLSQSLNGMTPEQISALQGSLSKEEQKALAQGLATISNANAKSGIPNTEGVTDATRDSFIPAAGSLINLPDGMYQELSRDDRVDVGPLINAPGAIQPNTVTLNGVGALQDVADIFKPAEGGYLNGSEATKAMLEGVTQYADADIQHRGAMSGPLGDVLNSDHRDYPGSAVMETGVNNALADIMQVAGNDHVSVHELATGDTRELFLRAMTQEHWGDRSDDIGNTFNWMDDNPGNRVNSETASSVAHYLADKSNELKGLPGGGTFGEQNGALATAMAEGLSPYLGQLAGLEGGPDNGVVQFDNSGKEDLVGMSDMFTVLNQSNDAAIIINAAGTDAYESIIADNASTGMNEKDLRTAGRISEAMNLGASESNLFERETARWEEAVRQGDQKDYIDNWKKLISIVPHTAQSLALAEIGMTLASDDPKNPALIQGGDLMKTLVQNGGATTNPTDYNATVLNGLIQANPAIANDPQLAPILTDGQIDPNKVSNPDNDPTGVIDRWFREVGPNYNFSQETLNTWRRLDNEGRGTFTDWTR